MQLTPVGLPARALEDYVEPLIAQALGRNWRRLRFTLPRTAGHGVAVAGCSVEVAHRTAFWLCLALVASCGGRGEQSAQLAAPTPHGGAAGSESASAAGGPAALGGGGAGDLAGSAGSGGALVGGGAGEPVGGEAAGGVGAVEPIPRRPIRALQVATGRDHSCALLENHQIKCWGENSYGELGLGDQTKRGLHPSLMGDQLPFVDLGAGRSAKAVAAGRYTTCALLDNDQVKCWGLELLRADPAAPPTVGAAPGQMGDALLPIDLGPGHSARGVAIGYVEACVVRDDDSFWCGGTVPMRTNVPAAADARPSSWTGAAGVLALYDDGSARSIAPAEAGLSKVLVPSGVSALAGAEQLSCALLLDGSLQCFGVGAEDLPLALPATLGMAISERGVLCAISMDGSVRCWGELWPHVNWGTATSAGELLETISVPLTGPAAQLSSSARDHHCALLVDGSVECWPWIDVPVAGVGWNDGVSGELRPVDLGTWPE